MIKVNLIIMISYIHKLAKIGGDINSSFLDLIPKESNPSSNKFRFCPLSLCNVFYNIVFKIIANWIQSLVPKFIPKTKVDLSKRGKFWIILF